MEDYKTKWKALEDKYYPITWDINDGQIEIHCKNGKLLPIDHKIYSMEANFIQDQIKDYSIYSGEICCV